VVQVKFGGRVVTGSSNYSQVRHIASLVPSTRLRTSGYEAIIADFAKPYSVIKAINAVDPDVVVSAAGVNGILSEDFKASRDSIKVIAEHLSGSSETLVFTSGSGTFGVFAGGDQSAKIYPEDTLLPLPEYEIAPKHSGVPRIIIRGFKKTMAARIEAEQAVCCQQIEMSAFVANKLSAFMNLVEASVEGYPLCRCLHQVTAYGGLTQQPRW